jgi:DNA polymerase V
MHTAKVRHLVRPPINKIETFSVPMVPGMYLPGSRSSAGFPSPADDYIDKQLDLNELLIQNRPATFFMRVDGNALQSSGINHGDMLIVDRSINATQDKIVVAVVAGELVVRRAENSDNKLILTSDENSGHEVVDGDDIQIWGVATSVIHQL